MFSIDWSEIIIGCVPAVITSIVSYLIARHQGRNDLKKAAQENTANIERLMKQHQIDIESLREKHKMDLELKDKEQEHKLQLMQKECELKIAENKAQKTNDVTNDAAAGIVQLFMQNPKRGKQIINDLVALRDSINGNK